METEVFTTLSLGFILGLKHALDADHLVAVSTIVSERKGWFGSSIIGALWGLGHTAALLVVGLLVIAMHIRIPDRVALAMEFAVAAMLVVLGVRVLWKLFQGELLHVHIHQHNGHTHIHPHTHPFHEVHEHQQGSPSHHSRDVPSFLENMFSHAHEGKRSILVGLVHGMAGSAALMLVVLATISSTRLALLYIGVFGVGSIGGMMVMSTLLGIPFMLTAHASISLNRIVRGIAGAISIGFGLFLGWQIGFVEGLFLLR